MKQATFNVLKYNSQREITLHQATEILFSNTGTSVCTVNNKEILPGKQLQIAKNLIIPKIDFKIDFSSNNLVDNQLEVAFIHIIENNIC